MTADQPVSRILLPLLIVDTIDTNHICILVFREGRPRSQIIHTPLLGCIRETLTAFVEEFAELLPNWCNFGDANHIRMTVCDLDH